MSAGRCFVRKESKNEFQGCFDLKESKNLNIGSLLDFYGELLTDKQADALDLYYNQDLSLGEIAELMGITRQGVRDNIKRGEKQLEDFEKALSLNEKFSEITTVLSVCKENLIKVKDITEADGLVDEVLYGIGKIEDIM